MSRSKIKSMAVFLFCSLTYFLPIFSESFKNLKAIWYETRHSLPGRPRASSSSYHQCFGQWICFKTTVWHFKAPSCRTQRIVFNSTINMIKLEMQMDKQKEGKCQAVNKGRAPPLTMGYNKTPWCTKVGLLKNNKSIYLAISVNHPSVVRDSKSITNRWHFGENVIELGGPQADSTKIGEAFTCNNLRWSGKVGQFDRCALKQTQF